MQFFPLRRLEKITDNGLSDKLKVNETDARILKTLKILRASNKLYGNAGNSFFAKLSTWYLDENDVGPSRRIVNCERKFIQNIENNPNYKIAVDVPFKLDTEFGKGYATTDNIATITYSSKSGKQGTLFQAELEERGKSVKMVNKIFNGTRIKKLMEDFRSYVIIQQAYDFDTAYKEANI